MRGPRANEKPYQLFFSPSMIRYLDRRSRHAGPCFNIEPIQLQSNQVYCHVTPKVVKLVPIRSVTPSDQFNFREWPLAMGRENVSPTLVFSWRSSFWTPLAVVRPPA